MKKSKIVFLSFCFSFLIKGVSAQNFDKIFNELNPKLEKVLKESKAVGYAVAVVKKDSLIYAKGFGYRDFENKVEVTPNTLFAIGSTSKAFTVSLLGLMNEEGKLEFDNLAKEYLPQLKFSSKELDDNVSVRDLILHRTGLPRYDYSWYLFNTDSRDSLLKRVSYFKPTAPLRQTYQYNNWMYLVQGMIAERYFKNSWENLIKEKFFVPLNMKNSNTSILEMQKNKDFSFGYTLNSKKEIEKTDFYDINGMGPAGAINSNVNEMANWLKVWINNGNFGSKKILSPKYISEAMSSQMVVSKGLPSKKSPDLFISTYGFGWGASSYKGHYRVSHGGNIDGFTADVSFYPTDSLGIVVLVNQNASAVSSVVRNLIIDKVLNLDETDWIENFFSKSEDTSEEIKPESNQKLGTSPSHNLKSYEGIFVNKGYGTFEVVERNDSLFTKLANREYYLKHYHYDVFKPFERKKSGKVDSTSNMDLPFLFQMDVTGNISSVSLEIEDHIGALSFEKQLRETKVDLNTLKKYVGEYELTKDFKVKFYIKNNELHAFVAGQPEYRLVSLGNDNFGIEILKGYNFQFVEKDGKYPECKAIQPNGTFILKKTK